VIISSSAFVVKWSGALSKLGFVDLLCAEQVGAVLIRIDNKCSASQ